LSTILSPVRVTATAAPVHRSHRSWIALLGLFLAIYVAAMFTPPLLD